MRYEYYVNSIRRRSNIVNKNTAEAYFTVPLSLNDALRPVSIKTSFLLLTEPPLALFSATGPALFLLLINGVPSLRILALAAASSISFVRD